MLEISGNASSDGVTGEGVVVQTNWNLTESTVGREIGCCHNCDDWNQFAKKKQRGPVEQILQNMKEDGSPDRWWAVGGTAALWQKSCCGGFGGRQSLLLLRSK